ALMQRVKAVGSLVVASATTVEEAVFLEANGVDAIIAQGFEAGGHRGMFLTEDLTSQAGTMALVPQIVDAVRLPVIAAGGIGDARSGGFLAAVVGAGAAPGARDAGGGIGEDARGRGAMPIAGGLGAVVDIRVIGADRPEFRLLKAWIAVVPPSTSSGDARPAC